MSRPPKPPAHLAPFVHALGVDLAIRFLLRFGGAEMYIAASPSSRSLLVREFGEEAAAKIAAACARLPRRIPLGKEWIAEVWAYEGLATAEIARRLHVTDVTIRNWRAKAPWRGIKRAAPQDNRQLPLL